MEQLDPTIVNMAKAIKTSETGGRKDAYTTRGKSGEYGAYQYTPQTWANDAKTYLGQDVPLEQASVEQQNKVAYYKIKSLKDKGLTPVQVASVWNSGDLEAHKGTFSYDTPTHKKGDSSKGYNSHHVYYDVPQYAKSVVQTYEQLKSGVQPNAVITPPNPSSTTGNTPTPSDSASNDVNAPQSNYAPGFDNALGKIATGTAKTFLGPLISGGQFVANQTAGRVINALQGKGFKPTEEAGYGDEFNKQLDAPSQSGLETAGKVFGTAAPFALGATSALAELTSTGKALSAAKGTALATEEAQSVLNAYAQETGATLKEISSSEAVNALTEAAQGADAATQPILAQAAKEALAMRLKQAGIGTLAELSPVKAKALGISWSIVKFLLRTGADVAGVGLYSRLVK